MDFSEYYLNSNNGKKFTKKDFDKEINRSQFERDSETPNSVHNAGGGGTPLSTNSSHLSLFDKFDFDHDGKLKKDELSFLFERLANFASKDGNNVLDENEAQQYLDELNGFLSLGGKGLQLSATAQDLLSFVEKVVETSSMEGMNLLNSKVIIPHEVKNVMPVNTPTEVQTKEFAVQNLRAMFDILNDMAEQSDVDIEKELSKIGFKMTDLLIVPFVKRQVNRANSQKEHASSSINTKMMMDAYSKAMYFLEKSLSEEGLTYREYYGYKKECLKSALIEAGWPADDKTLDQRLESVTFEGLDVLAAQCLDDPQGILKRFKQGTERPERQTTLNLSKNGEMFTANQSQKMIPAPALYSQAQMDEIVPFEKVFLDTRGKEYNADDVNHFLAVESMLYYSPLDPERENAYRSESSSAFIKALGQPEREIFTSIEKTNTRTDWKLRTAVLDENGNEVTSIREMNAEGNKPYVVPQRDLLAKPVPLSEEQLQSLGADILYNIIAPATSMVNQYYEDTKNNLLDGNATWQGFRIMGHVVSLGKIDTIHDDLQKYNDLNLKAIHLKVNSNNSEKFKTLFQTITGVEYSPEKMQQLADLIQLGEAPDSEKYKTALKDALGLELGNLSEDTENSVNTQRQMGQITGIVQMLAVTAGLGELAIFKNAASAAYGALGDLGGSMVAGAMNMGAYEALMETGNVIGRSVYNDRMPTQADLEGILDNTVHGMAFGAAAGVVQKFMVNPVMAKIDPKVQTRAFGKVDKLLNNGTLVTGSDIISTIQKTSPLLGAQAAGFMAEVAGFTGYSMLEKAFTDIATGKFKLPETDNDLELVKAFFDYMGETFDEQFESLGTIKGIGQLLQFMRGGKAGVSGMNQRMRDTGLNDVTVKAREMNDGSKKYLMTYKDGSFKEVSSMNEVVGRLNAQLNGRMADVVLADLQELLSNKKPIEENKVEEVAVEAKSEEVPTKETVAENVKPISEMNEAEMIERYNQLKDANVMNEEMLALTLELTEKGHKFGQNGRLDFSVKQSAGNIPSEALQPLRDMGVKGPALDVLEYNMHRVNLELLKAIDDPRLIDESLGTILVDVKPEDVPAKLEVVRMLKNSDVISVENQVKLIAAANKGNIETMTDKVNRINEDLNYLKANNLDAKELAFFEEMMCNLQEPFSREIFELVKDKPEVLNSAICFANSEEASVRKDKIQAIEAFCKSYIENGTIGLEGDFLEAVKQDCTDSANKLANHLYRNLNRVNIEALNALKNIEIVVDLLSPEAILGLSVKDIEAKVKIYEYVEDLPFDEKMARIAQATEANFEQMSAQFEAKKLISDVKARGYNSVHPELIQNMEQVENLKTILEDKSVPEEAIESIVLDSNKMRLYTEFTTKPEHKQWAINRNVMFGIAEGSVTDVSTSEIISNQLRNRVFIDYKNGREIRLHSVDSKKTSLKVLDSFPNIDRARLENVSDLNLHLLAGYIREIQSTASYAEVENAINNANISSLGKRAAALDKCAPDTKFHLMFCPDSEFDRVMTVLERRPEILDGVFDKATFQKFVNMTESQWNALKVPIKERTGENFNPEDYSRHVEEILDGGYTMDLSTWNGIERRRMLETNSGLGTEPRKTIEFDESKPLVHPNRPFEELPTAEALMTQLRETGSFNIDIKDVGGMNPAHTDPAVIKPKDRPYLGQVQQTDTSVSIGETRVWENDRLARDLLQNFYDGNGYTLEGVKISVEQKGDKYVVKIAGQGIFDYDRVLDFGATSKEGDSRSAGRHGEGSKVIAGNLLLGKGSGYVRYTSGDWVLDLGVSPENSFGQRVITKKITEAPERLEGTTFEFETTDAGLVESIAKAKDFFYNPGNKDFANLDFENDCFGIKFLPKGQKGNVYVVQRFEVEGQEGFDGTIDGMTLVFKKQPHDKTVVNAFPGRQPYSLGTGRNRVALSENQIEEMVFRYALTLPEEQLVDIIGNMRDVFLFDKHSKNTHILSSFTRAANVRKLKIDFGHNFYMAVLPNSSEADLEWVRKLGKIPVHNSMLNVGIPSFAIFKKSIEGQLIPKMDLTETQQKKLQIMEEAVKMFSSHLDLQHAKIITEGEASTPKYVVGELGSSNIRAKAIVDDNQQVFLGHWVKEEYLEFGNFFDLMATWLHENSHKVAGDGERAFNARLIELQQLIVDISTSDPSFGQQLRVLKQEFDKLNGRDSSVSSKEISPVELDEIDQQISAALKAAVDKVEQDGVKKLQVEKTSRLKKFYSRIMGKKADAPSEEQPYYIGLSERKPKNKYVSIDVPISTVEYTAATPAENMALLKETGRVAVDIPAPKGINPKISDTSILPEDRGLLGVEQNSSLLLDYNNAQEWSREVVARDLYQNFFDGHNGTLDGVKVEIQEVGGKYKIRISGQSEYNYFFLKTIGASGGKTVDPRAAGGFGEGAKMACKTLLGAELTDKITFASGDWTLDFSREQGVPRKEQHLARTLTENSQRVDGTYVEFETADMDLVRAVLDGKDYFGHSDNPDFKELQGNEDLGFRVLPKGQKGNLYYIQRYAIREKGNLDGALGGLDIVFKRGLTVEEKQKAGLKDDPDRKGLSPSEIKSITEQIAQSMTDSELFSAIQSLERFWVVDDVRDFANSYKLTAEEEFAMGLIEAAIRKKCYFDTKDSKIVVGTLDMDPRNIAQLKAEGYRLARKELLALGFKTAGSVVEELNKVVPIKEKTAIEEQKLALLGELLPEGTMLKIFNANEGRETVRFVDERCFYYVAIDRNYLANADFNTLYTNVLSQAQKARDDFGKKPTDSDWGYNMTRMIAKQLELSQDPQFMAKFNLIAKRFANIGKY